MKDQMREVGLDYLVLRLPENVLYTTGYWPAFGAAVAVFPLEGEATVFYVEGEQEFVNEGWVRDARAYAFGSLDDMVDIEATISSLLKGLWTEKGYDWKGTVGYEGDFILVAANNVSAEARVPAARSLRMLRETFADASLVDATGAIWAARLIKSPLEIELLEYACDIAGFGYEKAREMMVPGVTEAQVAGAVEGAMYGSVGYKGVRRARGYCFTMSGPNALMAYRPFCCSSDRVLKEGDVVLHELDGFADGYFIDLTRTMVVGTPSPYALEIWDVVNEGLDAALEIVKPGAQASELTNIAQQVAIDRGYGEYFLHRIGHGVGLQFHEPPALHPKSTEILEKGMVFAVEPALYIQGWGAVRLEEVAVVTDDGHRLLSKFPREL
jgi:Xaa-Pro aminopeptidase